MASKLSKKNKQFAPLLALGVLLFSVLTPFIALGGDATSTNFILRDALFGIFGAANSTSTNFFQTSIGGQVAPGRSTSTNFILGSGDQYFDSYASRSGNWRWYDDENNETPFTALAGENIAPNNLVYDNTIKMRLTVDNLSGAAGEDVKYRLQFSEYSDFSQDVVSVDEIWSCDEASLWCYGDGGDADNDAISTLVLTDSTAFGTHNESGTSTTSFDPPGGEATEFEFTVRHAGARANTVYFFRAVNASTSEPVALGDGMSYPSIATEGASLTLTVNGVSASTPTEGITTDVGTTPTSVPFGSIPPGTQFEAAQRLNVSTNATEGYQIFVFQRQGLTHSLGIEIDPVTGTNPAPAGWGTGCLTPAVTGCYGYHAGDDVLSGASTRFSPNDTYARFDTTAREIAYSGGPVTNESTDIVFKTEVTNQQEGGVYESSIVYIVTPVF